MRVLNGKIIGFTGPSNSELLPCLLSIYDSIAAASKLDEAEKETEPRIDATDTGDVKAKSSTDEILELTSDRNGVQQSHNNATNEPSWCSSSKIDDNSFSHDRPNSCTSTTSISSQWSG